VVASVLSAATGAPHVRTAHGLPPHLGWSRRAVGIAAALDGALADWTGSTWIVVSGDLGRRMQGLRRTLHVVPNGIPPVPPEPDRRSLVSSLGTEERNPGSSASSGVWKR